MDEFIDMAHLFFSPFMSNISGHTFAHYEQPDRGCNDQKSEGYWGNDFLIWFVFTYNEEEAIKIPQCKQAAQFEHIMNNEVSQNIWVMKHPLQMFWASCNFIYNSNLMW